MIIPLFSFLSLIKRCILKESFITLASKKKRCYFLPQYNGHQCREFL